MAEVRDPAHVLAESRPKNKHGQLCPVWARRMIPRGRHAKIDECDCWILADARLDVATVRPAIEQEAVAERDRLLRRAHRHLVMRGAPAEGERTYLALMDDLLAAVETDRE